MAAVRTFRPAWGGLFQFVGLLLLAGAGAALTNRTARADAAGDYNVAVEFFRQERWPQSAQAFRAFLSLYADDARAPSARLYLGESLTNQRQFKEARDVFREFVKVGAAESELPLAKFRVAECSYFLNDSAAARDELAIFLRDHASHELGPRAMVYLGNTQLRLKDAQAAASTFEAALKQQLEERLAEDAKYGHARALESLGDKPGAIAVYRELAANTAGRRADDAQFNLGERAFDDGDYALAAREFVAVATTFPQSPLVSLAELNAGYSRYRLNEFRPAIAHFERAALDPQHADTGAFWIGLSQKSLGAYAEAAGTLEKQFLKDEQQPLADRLLFHWADSELRRADYAKAADLFQQVVRRQPDGDLADDALHSATEAALRPGRLDQAEELNQQFQQKYASSGLRLLQQLLAGRIRLARGDAAAQATPATGAAADHYRAAIEQFTQILSASNVPRTQALTRMQLARAWGRVQDRQQAVDTLQPLVADFEAGNGSAEFQDVLTLQAENLLALKRYDDAARLAELFVTRKPEGPDAAAALETIARAQAHLVNRGAVAAVLDRLEKADATKMSAAHSGYDAGEIAYAAKNWDWAADLYRRTAGYGTTTGYHAAALSGLGYSLYEAGRFKDAATAFGELLASHPEDRRLASNAAHMRGLAFQRAGDKEAAVQAFRDGITKFSLATDKTPPADADLDVGYNAYRCAKGAARALRELEKADDADRAYEAAYQELKKQPADRQAELDKLVNEWALLSYESEKFERSDELFNLLLKERPDGDLADDARLYLGESHFFAGRVDEARTLFQQLQSDAKADEFVRHRSLVLLIDIAARRKSWDDVLRTATTLAESFPMSEERWYAQYRIGEAALERGQTDRAVATLSGLKDQRDNPALARAEWFPSVYLLLAEARLRQQDYRAVEATLEELRARDPQAPYLYQADEILGRRFKNQAMFPEARAAFSRVIDSESGRRTETAAKAQLLIAETWFIKEDYNAALTEYYKVYVNYKFPEWQAPALFMAAQCDELLKNWKGAVQSYDTLLAEFPDSEHAEQARTKRETARKRAAL